MKDCLLPRRPRRRFLSTVAASGSLMVVSRGGRLFGAGPSDTSRLKIEVDEVRTISQTTDLYCGWPTMTRRRNGQLVVVWSGGRESHVCPFGRVEMMRSDDDGETWTWPRTLLDGPIDDRDAGVVETAKGTLLVTTFTSLAYQPQLDKQIELAASHGAIGSQWSKEKLDRWRMVHERISASERENELGQWMIRSTDGGVTWSARYRSIVNSPHGPVQLSDGRLLYAGKELWTGERSVGVCQSVDDGVTWQWLARIPARDGDDPAKYHELHAVETDSKKLLVHIRNHNKSNDREILQAESSDGGKTWSKPRSIDVWGLPSFLSRHRDGRLLMTYGHRRKPLGVQLRISSDDGKTWSDPAIIWGGGVSGDLGYPTTVQLDDGDLLSVWYERLGNSDKAVLRQARWRIDG